MGAVVFGPPGTGKTTYLTRQVGLAAEKGKSVLVASFTKTGAEEIGARIQEGKVDVGTLHSHCFKAIGQPDVITRQQVEAWNAKHRMAQVHTGGYASAQGKKQSVENVAGKEPDAVAEDSSAYDLMGQVDMARNLLTPMEALPARVREALEAWSAYKRECGVIDYVDMLELALQDTESALGKPDVMFLDEAQDSTPLQFAVWKKWAKTAQEDVVAGDDDQAIYEWAGADPQCLLRASREASNVRVLAQSYRVPRKVHAVAGRITDQIDERATKVYRPRDHEGSAKLLSASWYDAHPVIRTVKEAHDKGQTVMVLGSAGYMLDPALKLMREAGIPYGNHYKYANWSWNPLALGKKKVTAADRMVKLSRVFASPGLSWTAAEVEDWAKLFGGLPKFCPDSLVRKMKSLHKTSSVDPAGFWKEVGMPHPKTLMELIESMAVFLPPDLGIPGFFARCMEYLGAQHLQPLIEQAYQNERVKSSQNEWAGQEETARSRFVTVGSIHSVKGGEADVVVLFPDISRQAAESIQQGAARASLDALWRLQYVATTRARESLVICQPHGRHFMPLGRLLK